MRLKVNKTCLINDIPIQVESFWQGNFWKMAFLGPERGFGCNG